MYVSGSTCIASILRGNKLYVANIGDSRAVLGRMNDKGQIRALELSNDQKPDRYAARCSETSPQKGATAQAHSLRVCVFVGGAGLMRRSVFWSVVAVCLSGVCLACG